MSNTAPNRNPYVGLRPFECEDSLYFFGRRRQTAELLEQLHRNQFLAVVGSSGCGKSSLIRAGLIPALLGGFLVEDRDKWQIAVMKPGDAPLRNFAAALHQVIESEPKTSGIEPLQKAIYEEHTYAVFNYLKPRLGEDISLLLLIDQFEEIFHFRGTNDDDPLALANLDRARRRERAQRRAEANKFVDLVLDLAEKASLPVYIVLTMRSDFLGDCDLFYGLPEAMNRSRYLVPRLARSQLREAIEGPALLSGVTIAPRLLDQLLNELGDRRDRLPVLQHVLLRTWDVWFQNGKKGPLDLEHYELAGTLRKALSKHAEEALQDYDLETTAKIFKCLTDTDSSHRRVRRPSNLCELAAVTKTEPDVVHAILERFREGGRSFITISAGVTDDDPRIDISHESLIRQWGTLANWVDEERDSRDQFLELVARSRGKRALLQNPDLQLALNWYTSNKPIKAWANRYAIDDEDFGKAIQYLEQSREEDHRNSTLKLDSRCKSGAGWFYFIAVASVINSIVSITGGSWALIFSLGVTQLVDPLIFTSYAIPMSSRIIGVLFNAGIVGAFLIFGWYARKGIKLAFVIGMSLYFIDALIVIISIEDYTSLIFHAWVLFGLNGGLKACRELNQARRSHLPLSQISNSYAGIGV